MLGYPFRLSKACAPITRCSTAAGVAAVGCHATGLCAWIMNGTNCTTFGTTGSGTNQFNLPEGIFVDTAGKIYAAAFNNHRIARMDDMVGTNWTTLGGTMGSGTNQFDSPDGIFVDTAGKIYVADTGNHRIVRMDDMVGTNWITLGTAGTGTNQFNSPFSIFLR